MRLANNSNPYLGREAEVSERGRIVNVVDSEAALRHFGVKLLRLPVLDQEVFVGGAQVDAVDSRVCLGRRDAVSGGGVSC